MSRFRTNPWDLSDLLSQLDRQQIVLPEFQRNFVWWPKDIDLLLTSLAQDFPAGSLLFLRASQSEPLAWRAVEAVETELAKTPDYLVLDGQQRLTSLSLALNGRGDHLFFMDLELLGEGDLENGVFYLRRDQAHKRGLLDAPNQFEQHLYPASAIFGYEQRNWFHNYVDHHVDAGGDRVQLRDQTRDIEERFIAPLRNYRFPVVELPADTSLEAVCQIFETLNKSGMKLTVFDLLTAKFWPRGVRLREMLHQAREDYPLLGNEGFGVESSYLLQAISLMRTLEAPRCKRGDLLELSADNFPADWDTVTAAASIAMGVLRDDCGVLRREWLPYAALLPSLIAAATQIPKLQGPQQGSAWDKVRRWYWCSTFSQRYEGPANTLNATDVRQLVSWFADDDVIPEAVDQFDIGQLDLRGAKRQRSALYRSVICLTVANGARDFHTGRRITAEMLRDPNLGIEDHHIVPTAYLKQLTPSEEREDSVLNRCLIDGKTNGSISARPPAVYLAAIEDAVGADQLEHVLDSHLIPSGASSPLRSDPVDLEAFLRQRTALVQVAIAEKTGATLPDTVIGELHLHPSTPFTNDTSLRRLLRSLHGSVLWYEQHMDRKALEVLVDELDTTHINEVRLMSGPANLTRKTVNAYKRFLEEMSAQNVIVSWRVLPAATARDIHARVIYDETRSFELPPLGSILKGTLDSIRPTRLPRASIDAYWHADGAQDLLDLQLE